MAKEYKSSKWRAGPIKELESSLCICQRDSQIDLGFSSNYGF